MKKRTEGVFCFALSLMMTLGSMHCEHPVTGLMDLFPGPGFEKGWSWYGQPVVESEGFADRSSGMQLFDILESGLLTYFWGNVNDTAFTVLMYRCASADKAEALAAWPSIPDRVAGKFTGAGENIHVLKRMKSGIYAVFFLSDKESEKISEAVELVAERIENRIKRFELE